MESIEINRWGVRPVITARARVVAAPPTFGQAADMHGPRQQAAVPFQRSLASSLSHSTAASLSTRKARLNLHAKKTRFQHEYA